MQPQKIAAAFVRAKRAFGPALKDRTNPAFKSKYADLGACIDAVDDALLEQGIAFLHETFEDATGVTVETVFVHESGETLRGGKLHVPAAKQDPQGYGSALSYARRYSLMAACGIAPEDDDGNAATQATNAAAARKQRDAQRAAWLAGRKAAIAAAPSVGELRKIMDAALAIVRAEEDQDAEDQLLAASEAKVATVRARAQQHQPEEHA